MKKHEKNSMSRSNLRTSQLTQLPQTDEEEDVFSDLIENNNGSQVIITNKSGTMQYLTHSKTMQRISNSIETRLDPAWKTERLKMLINKYICVRCGNDFRDIDNIGSWKCTQHAYANLLNGELIPGQHLWPCCGKPVKVDRLTDIGCVPCDHTIKKMPWEDMDDINIPQAIVSTDFVSINPKAMIDEKKFKESREKFLYFYASGSARIQATNGDSSEISTDQNIYYYFRRFDFETHIKFKQMALEKIDNGRRQSSGLKLGSRNLPPTFGAVLK